MTEGSLWFFNFKSTNFVWWNVWIKKAWLCNDRCVEYAIYTNNVQATYFCLCLNKRSHKCSNKRADSRLDEPLPQQLAVSFSTSVAYLRLQAVPSADSLCVILIGVQNQIQDEAPLGCSINSTQISRSVFKSLSLRFKHLLLATTETEISKVPPLQWLFLFIRHFISKSPSSDCYCFYNSIH
jgi:hypothetical protein